MSHGPIEVFFLVVPPETALTEVVATLREPVDTGAIRLVDCVFLTRSADGEIAVLDLEAQESLPAELDNLAIDPHDLLNDGDLALLAETLSPDEIGVALVVELLWAPRAAERLQHLGVEVGLHVRVTPDEAEAAFAANDIAAAG